MRPSRSARVIIFGVIPLLAMLIGATAAYLKYAEATVRASESARTESVEVARDGAIAMLSYTPDTIETKLDAVRDRLTGTFRDSYSALIKDVVIPGTKQQNITATATVPAAASVSSSESHAVVVVFVNQAIIVGNDAPTNTASAVDVTLDKIDNRWLISGFDPK